MSEEQSVQDAENMVYFYILLHPNVTAEGLFESWYFNNVFCDYDRPNVNQLTLWVVDIWEELEEFGVRFKKQTV